LLIIEIDPGKILYFWSYKYHRPKNFPCLEFEIYEENFCGLTDIMVNPLSEKILPIIVDAKDKWQYFKKYGTPGNLTTESANFEEVVQRYKMLNG
jgi:hypothetical protein